jgi:hypothetical protein
MPKRLADEVREALLSTICPVLYRATMFTSRPGT